MPTEHRKQATALARAARELSRFVRSSQFRAALDEFHDNPAARKAASKDTAGYLEQRGIKIPDGMRIALKDNNWNVSLCVKAFIFEICIKYDATAGFSMAQ